MPHSIVSASQLLVENLPLLKSLNFDSGVLDLACGEGRNGLFLRRNNIPVTFADRNEAALDQIAELLDASYCSASCWLVDFESNDTDPLADKSFDVVLIFNYLHRPLFPRIREAVRPGGLVFYETFTVEQRKFGRPSNPDFLLRSGELKEYFEDWEILHYFEGELASPDRAIANLIARRT